MKSVILAAGMGSRLNLSEPKGLLCLPDGEAILNRQVRLQKLLGLNDINIVVGYKKELIMEKIDGVNYIYNADYAGTNTAKSLLIGIKEIKDDVIWTNGDLIYDIEVIEQTIKSSDNTVVVNTARCGEEEVKYSLGDNGRIVEISKQVVDARGEALGVNMVRRNTLADFKTALEECHDNDYFERGLQIIIDRGALVKPLDVSRHRCIEIDFPDDWAKAQEMFGNHK